MVIFLVAQLWMDICSSDQAMPSKHGTGMLFGADFIVIIYKAKTSICDTLSDLVPIVQCKKRENTYGAVLLLVKLFLTCNLAKSNTPPWVFFIFFKLCKWYQNAQRVTFL